VIRGGSWNNNASNLRSANRNNNNPDNANNNIGFRVALPAQAFRRMPEDRPGSCPSNRRAQHEPGEKGRSIETARRLVVFPHGGTGSKVAGFERQSICR
jgi:hypothetical protein